MKETGAGLDMFEVEEGENSKMDGTANENERRPFADRISGTVRTNLSRNLRSLVRI